MYRVCKKCLKAEPVTYELRTKLLKTPIISQRCFNCGAVAEDVVEIDDNFVSIITELWQNEYKTLACCAGHHGSCVDVKTDQTYIMFDAANLSYARVRNLVDTLASSSNSSHVDIDTRKRLTIDWHTTNANEHLALLARIARGVSELSNNCEKLDSVIRYSEAQNAISTDNNRPFTDVIISEKFFRKGWITEHNIGFTFYYEDDGDYKDCITMAEITHSSEHDGIIIQPRDSRFYPLLLVTDKEIKDGLASNEKMKNSPPFNVIELMKWLSEKVTVNLKYLDNKIKELGLSRVYTVDSVMSWEQKGE